MEAHMRILILIGALTLAAPAPPCFAAGPGAAPVPGDALPAGAAIMQKGDVIETPPARPSAGKACKTSDAHASGKACAHSKKRASGRPQAKPIKSY
jgi:hypothetical protein